MNDPSEIILHSNDVLFGRGGNNIKHEGNRRLRAMAKDQKAVHSYSSKREKSIIARSIIDYIRSLQPPGRFLKKDSTTGKWIEVPEALAREKTSQALRDAEYDVALEAPVEADPEKIMPCKRVAAALQLYESDARASPLTLNFATPQVTHTAPINVFTKPGSCTSTTCSPSLMNTNIPPNTNAQNTYESDSSLPIRSCVSPQSKWPASTEATCHSFYDYYDRYESLASREMSAYSRPRKKIARTCGYDDHELTMSNSPSFSKSPSSEILVQQDHKSNIFAASQEMIPYYQPEISSSAHHEKYETTQNRGYHAPQRLCGNDHHCSHIHAVHKSAFTSTKRNKTKIRITFGPGFSNARQALKQQMENIDYDYSSSPILHSTTSASTESAQNNFPGYDNDIDTSPKENRRLQVPHDVTPSSVFSTTQAENMHKDNFCEETCASNHITGNLTKYFFDFEP